MYLLHAPAVAGDKDETVKQSLESAKIGGSILGGVVFDSYFGKSLAAGDEPHQAVVRETIQLSAVARQLAFGEAISLSALPSVARHA